MAKSRIRDTGSDRIFTIVNYVVLTCFLITVLYPLLYIVSASFSSPEAVMSGRVWLFPVEFNLNGYNAVFNHKLIWSGFKNSIIYTVAGTAINVVMTLLAAYPLSRKDFFGRGGFMFILVFTMLFSGGLIPTYLLIKSLGMIDTRWVMIIPGALTVWNVIITRTYFQMTIPDELLEAAQMDGCTDFKFLGKVVLALSAPIIAVISLFYAIGHWNQFFNAMLYLKHQELYPLQLVLRDVLVQNELDASMLTDIQDAAEKAGIRELLKFSLIVVATVPVMAIYPFVQKYFVKGMMIGSLKG